MYLSPNSYKNVLRVIGFIFICGGILIGYSAFEIMFDPNASVVINGVSRSDAEAKFSGLFIPIIFICIGLWLCFSNAQSLMSLHKIRQTFWDTLFGK